MIHSYLYTISAKFTECETQYLETCGVFASFTLLCWIQPPRDVPLYWHCHETEKDFPDDEP